MKLDMEQGRDGGLCLRLIAETVDEKRILVMLDGAVSSTQALGSHGATTYLVSKPVALAESKSDVRMTEEG